MKRVLISCLLLLTACEPVAESRRAEVADARSTQGPTTGATTLKLMAWNVEWLWDGLAPEEGEIDFPWKGSREKAEAHMADVAGVIRRHDPDIVHLSEVENLQALTTLNERFLAGLGYRAYLEEGTDRATGQDVALLSRYPLDTLSRDPRRGRSGATAKAVSKHYVATLDAGGLRLGLVGIHLLARPLRESRRAHREAQADAVRRMARDLGGQGRSVIVWGDFNDFDGQTLDRSANRPITRVLEWIRGLDPQDPGDDLVNVSERLAPRERYTNGRDAIDHILVSPDLAQRITDVEIPHDHDRGITRHYPVVVELRP